MASPDTMQIDTQAAAAGMGGPPGGPPDDKSKPPQGGQLCQRCKRPAHKGPCHNRKKHCANCHKRHMGKCKVRCANCGRFDHRADVCVDRPIHTLATFTQHTDKDSAYRMIASAPEGVAYSFPGVDFTERNATTRRNARKRWNKKRRNAEMKASQTQVERAASEREPAQGPFPSDNELNEQSDEETGSEQE